MLFLDDAQLFSSVASVPQSWQRLFSCHSALWFLSVIVIHLRVCRKDPLQRHLVTLCLWRRQKLSKVQVQLVCSRAFPTPCADNGLANEASWSCRHYFCPFPSTAAAGVTRANLISCLKCKKLLLVRLRSRPRLPSPIKNCDERNKKSRLSFWHPGGRRNNLRHFCWK